jgi:hypothetical protein
MKPKLLRIARMSLLAGLLALIACDPPKISAPEAEGGIVSVVYNYPPDKEKGILLDAPVIVIFSEDVDDAKLKDFVEVKGGGSAVGGTVAYDEKDFEMTWTPEGGTWTAVTQYQVTVKKGLPSRDGANTLDADFTFSFTTQ